MERSSMAADHADQADHELFRRPGSNPVLTPADWPYRANAVMNPGAALVGDTTLLLCRVEDRRGLSHLTVARSADGLTGWSVDPKPLLAPSEETPAEAWGVEDPRLTRLDELDTWVISYTSYGPAGPAVSLALTDDFQSVTRLGVVCPPEDKNAALLPRRVGEHFVLFHRPRTVVGGHADVWLSRSTDLHSWLAPERVFGTRPGRWDCEQVGIGPPPLETPRGWLVAYHGVRHTVAGQLYRMGLALLDLDNPARVLHRSPEWVLSPRAPYEVSGDVPGVLFPCGWVHLPGTDELRVYYGAADTCVAVAQASLSEVLDFVTSESG